jgi:hypothetical protein
MKPATRVAARIKVVKYKIESPARPAKLGRESRRIGHCGQGNLFATPIKVPGFNSVLPHISAKINRESDVLSCREAAWSAAGPGRACFVIDAWSQLTNRPSAQALVS